MTGGGSGALDKLDGAVLSDKDGAVVITDAGFHLYFLDDDSGLAEDSPSVISPDTNPGNKRWILQNVNVAEFVADYQSALDPIPLFFENEILSFENEILTYI
jgi:hypothetical protein